MIPAIWGIPFVEKNGQISIELIDFEMTGLAVAHQLDGELKMEKGIFHI